MVHNPDQGHSEHERPSVEAPPPPPPPAPAKRVAPETHGRGVRMTIYLAGVAIMLALIGWIVFLPPDSPFPGGRAGEDGSEQSAPPEEPDPLLAADGTIDPIAYAAMAEKLATDEGMEWRYGPDWHEYHEKDAFGDLPTMPQPAGKPLNLPGRVDRTYQLGPNPPLDPSSLRNIQGQVGYIASEGQLPGVDHITAVETTDTTVGFAPRPGGQLSTDGHPEVELSSGKAAYCASDKDVPIGDLVGMARGDGINGASHAVMVFSQGLIATAGTSNTQDGKCLQLPGDLVPTAVAVTPGNEFALITVWDTEKIEGGLAVVALTGESGATPADWPTEYPALPNSGYVASMKLLGVVGLPGLVAPTGIGVTTDFHGADGLDRRQLWLTGPAARDTAVQNVATTGRAVITSVSEKKALVVDLTPLFEGVHDAYFAEDVTAPPVAGDGKNEWPYKFGGDKGEDMAPEIGATVPFTTTPNTAALSWDGAHGYVATRDGTLHVLDVRDAGTAAEVGTIDVGANPTCVTHTADGSQLLVTARGDRTVQWVDATGTGGSVTRTLRDSRLIDPICAQDLGSLAAPGATDEQITDVPVLAVADYGGELVHNYRTGDAVFADGSKAPLPGDGFEYGGGYDPNGKPFAVSMTLDR